MLYVHARGGRPTVTAYFTDDEYELVKKLLREEADSVGGLGALAYTRRQRIARRALERMQWHDDRRRA
jgi:hypothetical protein